MVRLIFVISAEEEWHDGGARLETVEIASFGICQLCRTGEPVCAFKVSGLDRTLSKHLNLGTNMS